MEISMQPSFCFERFGWTVGQPCDSIPYPFGITGKALPGFELNCHSGEANLLPSNNQSYVTQAIHINTVSISVGSIYNLCYTDNGSEIIEDNSDLLNLHGTPYTISTSKNVLVHVGCDCMLKINSTNHGMSGCAVFCEPPGDNIKQNWSSCSGLGCCTATLPGGAMKSFNLEFEHITSGTIPTNCSVSFISEERAAGPIGVAFAEIHDSSLILDSKDKNYYPYIQNLTLQWSIGNSTCQEASNGSDIYLCKNNSDCYNSEFGGYYCNCSQGFQGNPYVLGGCTGN
jgi:hypothetical protein